jgi:hypothetical protein
MRLRSIAGLPLLLGLAGCMSAEERQKMYNTPPPANHATPAARKAVAAMAISVNKYPAEIVMLSAREPKFGVFHVEAPKIGEEARTIYCVKAGMQPMFLKKPLDLPIMEHLVATIRVMDTPSGKLNMLAFGGSCSKIPTEPFPELIEVARSAFEAAKNRPVSTPIVEDTR